MDAEESVRWAGLFEKARAVRRASRRLTGNAWRMQEEWRAWHRAWRHAARTRGSNRQRIILICTYCHRLREPDGRWTPLPRKVESRLAGRIGKYVSHGLCPACLAEKFPRFEAAILPGRIQPRPAG